MNKKNVNQITLIAIFAGIIVVLQSIATFIRFGSFPISLTLIPIIVAGASFGIKIGSLMGFVFGAVTLIYVVIGADATGFSLFAMNPVAVSLLCLVKGTLAGFFSSLIYSLLSKKDEKLAIILASAIAPITNTGVFCIFLLIFFDSGISILYTSFISINFLIEFLINVILSPGLTGIIVRGRNIYTKY